MTRAVFRRRVRRAAVCACSQKFVAQQRRFHTANDFLSGCGWPFVGARLGVEEATGAFVVPCSSFNIRAHDLCVVCFVVVVVVCWFVALARALSLKDVVCARLLSSEFVC